MNKKTRRGISKKIEDEVIFLNDHTCCVCHDRNKAIQIHHIDGDPSNNHIQNLAILCLECHDKVTRRPGLGRSFTPGEVAMYKRNWEKYVRDLRHIPKIKITHSRELFSQIDIIICEILAIRKNEARARELFDLLYELHLYRSNPQLDKVIINGMHHLAIMIGLKPDHRAPLLAHCLWKMCWHLSRPYKEEMNKRDQYMVLECLDALDALIYLNCGIGHGRKTIEAASQSLESFYFELALPRGCKRIASQIIHIFEEALMKCYKNETLEFGFGKITLQTSIRRLLIALNDEQPSWLAQKMRLKKLLNK